MKTVNLSFGRFDREWTLFHILSVAFDIEPKVYSLDAFSSFLRNNGGFHVEIRYWDLPYGAAAQRLQDVLRLFENIRSDQGPEYLDYTFVPHDQVVLDFRECKDSSSLYDEMRQKMKWEEWYGTNLDALWDILTGLPYHGDDFVILRPRHYRDIAYGQDAYFTSMVDKICAIFQEAQDTFGFISVQIQYCETI